MSLYDQITGLDLTIDAVEVDSKTLQVSDQFVRETSIIELRGGGVAGRGEDVTYERAFHRFPDALLDSLAGTYEFDEFSASLDGRDLFPSTLEPDIDQRGHRQLPGKRRFRRWALESAALDLALKQRDTTLAEALGETYHPLRFVVSPSADEQTYEQLTELRDAVPGIEFKLNAMPDWEREHVSEIAALGNVSVVDLKSHYDLLGVDPDPDLYAIVAAAFDDALIEDPKVIPETRAALEGHEERVTWDKPVTGIDSIEALPIEPTYLNIKPSRIGTVRSLLETIEYCQRRGIRPFGGGQFELGVGRQHAQALASIWYPDAPNDLAPPVYNESGIPEEAPQSPLEPDPNVTGLQWRPRT